MNAMQWFAVMAINPADISINMGYHTKIVPLTHQQILFLFLSPLTRPTLTVAITCASFCD